MMTLNPSMRPRVKPDTYAIDDGAGGVYLQNNEGSFRFEGQTIARWIEKLLPMFTGEHTLGDLTDELPVPYKNRVYDIASVLHENGYIQDLSLNLPHHLSEQVQKAYAPQIEFLENVLGSGAYHFESYRSRTAMVIGSDPSILPLVSALFESGLPKVHLVTLSTSVNRSRLKVILEHARVVDPEAELVEVWFDATDPNPNIWSDVIRPYDSIFYVSQAGDIGELLRIHAACTSEGKIFLPATVVHQTGMVGPVIHPKSAVSWESAWRRVHETAVRKDPGVATFSSTAAALLTNTLVFELFKLVTGVTSSESNKFYLLDLETFQGDWHNFLPHPRANDAGRPTWVYDLDALLSGDVDTRGPGELFDVFRQLTSPVCGIFHSWDEGGLKQLPLAQCRVQPVDPLSNGTAGLLPEIICTGINHEEARREAGWSGIEAYVSRYARISYETKEFNVTGGPETFRTDEFVGVGGGATVAEAVSRGLQKCLSEELHEQYSHSPLHLVPVECDVVEDERCAYDLQVLTSIQGVPAIAFGQKIHGFPVVWVKVRDVWYGSVDLTVTVALRRALESALTQIQHSHDTGGLHQLHATRSVILDDTYHEVCTIEQIQASPTDLLKSAITVLQAHGQRMMVIDLALEPFLKELPAVLGVLLRSEGSE